jgi:hypothetical protein
VRVGLWAGLAGALTLGLVRAARWFRDVGTPPPTATWPPFPDSTRAVPEPVYEMVPDPVAEPVGGSCPDSHPVKGKTSSGLYHLPGMVAYGRTNADSCFVDADAAEAAGFTRAKR